MAMSRYIFSKKVKVGDNEILSTNLISPKVHRAIESGRIPFKTKLLEQGERLDTLAALMYGDSAYWWAIAAASGIGWSLQVPPGTYLRIPINLNDVFRALS